MDRQTLRDWVVRYNARGSPAFATGRRVTRSQGSSEGERASLANVIFRGPDPDRDGLSAWTLPTLCELIETRFGNRLHPARLSRILRTDGFSRQKVRPSHPRKDEKALERFKKGGSPKP